LDHRSRQTRRIDIREHTTTGTKTRFRGKLAIASVACAAAAALSLSPAASAKPKKTEFKEIARSATFAASVFGPRAELTTREFNPGPHGKIRVQVGGTVTENSQYGAHAAVSGTLTCSQGKNIINGRSVSNTYPTFFPFTLTFRTSVTGIKDPKVCVLHLSSYWDPQPPPSDARLWPKGVIATFVDLKK
jgi:hypothetical protein